MPAPVVNQRRAERLWSDRDGPERQLLLFLAGRDWACPNLTAGRGPQPDKLASGRRDSRFASAIYMRAWQSSPRLCPTYRTTLLGGAYGSAGPT